ncbi:hypothetical protein [Methylobacterium mesophilicum]|uniref:hypothetical protein n=1 Tax=Methylobacterium mesophilicum TaxID=39956 RepID=UPI0013032B97|nr:hypothetical protein [Methylobacterium mesophilicum]
MPLARVVSCAGRISLIPSWDAEGEAAIRTVVDTARLTGSSSFDAILKTIGA